ncbi:hypothetical protein NX801_21210 [Streptomyces sp. LP05-1]|uniref:Uncharacterized protein n=1 Tax=Streptomyces pyxinae TaxID=2970734 RepID=A0ABT2CL28_9ACTN|nr:hypothetical protein [Streptomyces sp. LP05-1]MCS0638127.1 hypothetical protein [Streptomyces sp. LP05-1]
MAGSVDPPEGTPGGEDEYRSVVFDESFVRAARIEEFSARQRMEEAAPAVRSRPAPEPGPPRRGYGALLLVPAVMLVFAAVVFVGARHPYPVPAERRAEPLRTLLVSLAPRGPVPGGRAEELYARSPAAQFRTGAAGIPLPPGRRTAHFSENQVMAALATAKDYLVRSSLDIGVLRGEALRPVRLLLDPDQAAQFDRSLDAPADDGRHAPAGWLVRFDPRAVTPVATARVRGTLSVSEVSPDLLEVASDHTFAYALRPARSAPGRPAAATASLFTVRRELRFRFDREDLRMHRTELLESRALAGPQDCAAGAGTGELRPLTAGRTATRPDPAAVATDPYEIGRPVTPLCGTLSPAGEPEER